MKLFFHHCLFGYSNCYVLGAEDCGEAVIVDPGDMDEQLLGYIEKNNFNPVAVLITHNHKGHIHGLRTLRQIYQPKIFAINHMVADVKTEFTRDGDRIKAGPYSVEVISIPGHSADSAVYLAGNLLFTGDVLTAGLVGSTASAYGAATQMNNLRSRLLSLPGDYIVLPGHGPPSTLEAERRFNVSITQFKETQGRRPTFKLDFS